MAIDARISLILGCYGAATQYDEVYLDTLYIVCRGRLDILYVDHDR